MEAIRLNTPDLPSGVIIEDGETIGLSNGGKVQVQSSTDCYVNFVWSKKRKFNLFNRHKVKLGLMLTMAMLIQSLHSSLYLGWPHWHVLLIREGLIDEACTSAMQDNVTGCIAKNLDSMFLIASAADLSFAVFIGILLDQFGSYPLLCLGWVTVFTGITSFHITLNAIIAHSMIITLSFFRIQSLLAWKMTFFFFGASGSMFNFGLMDLSNHFPHGAQIAVLNMVVVSQIFSPLVMSLITNIAIALDVVELYKIMTVYFYVTAFPLSVLSLIYFESFVPKNDDELKSVVMGTENKTPSAEWYQSHVELGIFNGYVDRKKQSVTRLVPPNDPTVMFDCDAECSSPSYPTQDEHQAYYGPAVITDIHSMAMEDAEAPDCMDRIIEEWRRLKRPEILITLLLWFVPSMVGTNHYWVNVPKNTSTEFATSLSSTIPFIAIGAMLIAGPVYEVAPPSSVLFIMLLTSFCQSVAHFALFRGQSNSFTWLGGILYALSMPLIDSARFCFFKTVLIKNYGVVTGLSSTLAGVSIPLLLLKDYNPAFENAFKIYFTWINFPLHFILITSLYYYMKVPEGGTQRSNSGPCWRGSPSVRRYKQEEEEASGRASSGSVTSASQSLGEGGPKAIAQADEDMLGTASRIDQNF